jgi:hypothetical protein
VNKLPTKTRPASLHWMMTPGQTWTGTVVLMGQHVIDTERHGRKLPKSLRPFCRVKVQRGLDGNVSSFRLDFVAPSKRGQTYSEYPTLGAAIDAGRRWAGRRFRIVEE